MTAMAHPSLEALLAYWLGDDPPAEVDAIDAHLMGCDDCGRRLDDLVALGQGVRDALRAGAVTGVASAAFVGRLAAQGLQLREYRVPPGGSVDCTVAPGDALLVSRLEAPLAGVERLDLQARLSTAPDAVHTWPDVPFDPAAGEVVFLPRIAAVRELPAHTAEMTLLAVHDGEPREIARYTFRHRPWAEP